MMKSLLIIASFMILNITHALEVDEKLTLRFLKVSNSKKTVLINRGSEDGLVVGNHAKFFITSGVIARGVVEKVSPSRSIWSLYRVVDAAEITDGKVLNLKIATPVKITDDPSKSLKEEPIPGGTEKMDMKEATPSASETPSTLNEADKKELEGLGGDEAEKPVKAEKKNVKETKEVTMEEEVPTSTTSSKNWEVWGIFSVNQLSGTVNNPAPTPASSTTANSSNVDFSAGIERYFLNSSTFFKDVSLMGFIHERSSKSGQDIKVETDWFEFGGGANYHFYNPTDSIGKVIGYATVNGGAGSANLTDTQTTSITTKGTTQFIAAGVGAKYILSNGFGARALADYYRSSESYSFTNATVTRTLAGPRVQFGLSYRF